MRTWESISEAERAAIYQLMRGLADGNSPEGIANSVSAQFGVVVPVSVVVSVLEREEAEGLEETEGFDEGVDGEERRGMKM